MIFLSLYSKKTLKQTLKDGFNEENFKRVAPVAHEVPEYIQVNDQEEKGHTAFFVMLKFSLLSKLKSTRPQYFQEGSNELENYKSLTDRLECLTSTSNLISQIKVTMAKILHLVYDYYLGRLIESEWTMFRKILHQWVNDCKSKKSIHATHQEKNADSRPAYLSGASHEQEVEGSFGPLLIL